MDYELEFQFKLYQNHFKHPLRTSHGVWRVRKGIIVSLTNAAGITSQGEIAPLPWFGSETLEQAREFCQQVGKTINQSQIMAISDSLPCCQFALESAYLAQKQSQIATKVQDLDFCYLLPAGEKALTAWQDLLINNSATTLKWKIGVFPLEQELKILNQLSCILPPEIKLRLDANGGLSLSQAQQLLSLTDSLPNIEFIEQPLAPEKLTEIFQLSQTYSTLLALDESVASFRQLQQVHQAGWQGIFVIKAAIMGFPGRLIQFCQHNALDFVFSSVLETDVARHTVLNLAQQLNHTRALGFGVQHFVRMKD
ncbi:MAG: o-succinylbenzoate synthase [Cyanobacteria bacterium P01_C01_bin.72]